MILASFVLAGLALYFIKPDWKAFLLSLPIYLILAFLISGMTKFNASKDSIGYFTLFGAMQYAGTFIIAGAINYFYSKAAENRRIKKQQQLEKEVAETENIYPKDTSI